jgi:hypothetical protein
MKNKTATQIILEAAADNRSKGLSDKPNFITLRTGFAMWHVRKVYQEESDRLAKLAGLSVVKNPFAS